jgi:hypothetical protein
VNWVAIVAIFEAVLGALMENCAKTRLERAAKRLPPAEKYGSEGEAASALIDEAISMTWRPMVRLGLRRMKSAVIEGKKLRKRPLTADELAEGKELLACVSGE